MTFRRVLWDSGYGAIVLAACFATGCSRTTSRVADVTGPVREERRLLEPDEPPFRSEWQVTAHTIEGRLTWQSCELERWWTEKRVKTVKHEKYTGTGAAFVGVGSVLALLGAVTMDDKGGDNAGPLLLDVSGVALAVAGIALLAGPSGTTTETLSQKRKHELQTGSCLPTRDFAQLLFALKVGRALWPVRVSPHGDAHVEVPDGASVPPEVDLQLVVFRAPAGAADLVEKGQVLETLRLPSGR